jgi:Hemerythrin HHE cation binding domain
VTDRFPPPNNAHPGRRRCTPRKLDALDLLTRDHDAIKQLFWDYERLKRSSGEPDLKAEIVGRICFGLSIHAQIEEELFYPAVRAAIGQDTWAGHAARDHAACNDLIAELDEMEPGDGGYDATVAALCARTVRHMDDEQAHLFAKVRSAGLDTAALRRQLIERRKALHEDVTRIGLPSPATAGAPTWPATCHVVMA